MSKKIMFIIILAAAVALPVATHFAIAAHDEHKSALRNRTKLQKRQAELNMYSDRLSKYRKFADRAQNFVRKVELTGVGESGWNRHRVQIKQRAVSYSDLDKFIAETNNGPNSYFIPEKLELKTDGHPVDGVLLSLEGEYLVNAK